MGNPKTKVWMDKGGSRLNIGAGGELSILGLVTGGNEYTKAYYVDNINGDAGNDGSDWNNAFAQISPRRLRPGKPTGRSWPTSTNGA